MNSHDLRKRIAAVITVSPPRAAEARRQPTTPADLRDLLADIMAEHERTTCSPEATALGSLILIMLDLAHAATPDDPNGKHLIRFLQLNPEQPLNEALRCRDAFTIPKETWK